MFVNFKKSKTHRFANSGPNVFPSPPSPHRSLQAQMLWLGLLPASLLGDAVLSATFFLSVHGWRFKTDEWAPDALLHFHSDSLSPAPPRAPRGGAEAGYRSGRRSAVWGARAAALGDFGVFEFLSPKKQKCFWNRCVRDSTFSAFPWKRHSAIDPPVLMAVFMYRDPPLFIEVMWCFRQGVFGTPATYCPKHRPCRSTPWSFTRLFNLGWGAFFLCIRMDTSRKYRYFRNP